MAFTLPELPYERGALAPHISEETLNYHYGKHHQAYVNKLNAMTEGTDNASKSLEEIIMSSEGGLFNQAAQVWNHTFYWNSMSPTGAVKDALEAAFGSVDAFKEKFSGVAAGAFGSAWAWLVQDKEGKLDIVATFNAGNPMTDGLKPLLTCDVWEHAYYVDYRNARPEYIKSFWNLVNWDFIGQNMG